MQNCLFTALYNTSSECAFLARNNSEVICKTHNVGFKISVLDGIQDISKVNEEIDKTGDESMTDKNADISDDIVPSIVEDPSVGDSKGSKSPDVIEDTNTETIDSCFIFHQTDKAVLLK